MSLCLHYIRLCIYSCSFVQIQNVSLTEVKNKIKRVVAAFSGFTKPHLNTETNQPKVKDLEV